MTDTPDEHPPVTWRTWLVILTALTYLCGPQVVTIAFQANWLDKGTSTAFAIIVFWYFGIPLATIIICMIVYCWKHRHDPI